MYCSSCGNQITRGLNYCSQCGATLIAAPLSRLVGLVWTIPLAMAVITLGGLGMVFVIGYELVRRGAEISALTALLLLVDVLVVVLIDWMLLRQLSRVIDIYRPSRTLSGKSSRELGDTSVSQIEAPCERRIFATEETTQIFQGAKRR